MVCIACKNEHTQNFCPNCGERAGVPRITFQSVFQEAFSSITNMDKGILYTLKHLTIQPKEFIEDYVKGKRKGISNPIAFLIIATTIYLILETLIESPSVTTNKPVPDEAEMGRLRLAGREAGYLIHKYLKYFWVLIVFWLSTSTRLLFGKYNFIEHITINSFIIGYATILGMLGIFIFKMPLPVNVIVYVVMLITLYRVFETKKDKFGTVVQSVFSLFFLFVKVFLTLLFIGYLRT